MKNTTKGNILKTIAIVIDVGAPLTATLTQFPVWIDRQEINANSRKMPEKVASEDLSFLNYIKAYFRSPAVWVVWLVLFVFLFAISNIINEMLIVCFVGLIANCIGAILYKIGKTISMKP